MSKANEYAVEYFYDKSIKNATILTGLVLVAVGVWLWAKTPATIFLVLTAIFIGLFLTFFGIQGRHHKKAILKITTDGLWTAKLGFLHWDDIHDITFLSYKRRKGVQRYLNIQVKSSTLETAKTLHEKLLLSDLTNHLEIESVLHKMKEHYFNSQRGSSNG